ncbi:MAG: GNAT family N-acetyltransferase [Bosea sp. (in: a-proteobacteria)]
MSVTIREALETDVAAIAALIRMGASHNPASREDAMREASHPDYLKGFEAVSASPDTWLYVAEEAGRVVGTVQRTLLPGIAERGRLRSKIESVHVDPEFRGRGIGKLMVAHALEQAKAKGAGIMELTSNKVRLDAHRFYRELGFEQGHEGFKKVL